MQNAIAYVRRSTKGENSQVHSLETQKNEIMNYAKKNGIVIVSCYCESISGTIENRPEFMKAVKEAKKKNLPIISKSLSRIGRNASQVLKIIEDTQLIITDYGRSVDSDFLSIMAIVSSMEVKATSRRTKQSLRYLRDVKGVKLGNRTNIKEAGDNGRKQQAIEANKFCMKLAPIVMNDMNHSAMARQLNALEIKTRRGKEWRSYQVAQLRKRIRNINN
tara:strand:- start:116 stop:772 length:657 start_codon:yes stop_codon:yes gene_type:complete